MTDIVEQLRAEAEAQGRAADYIVELRKKWEELIDAKWEIERLGVLNAELLSALREIASNRVNSRAWLENKARDAIAKAEGGKL